MPPSDFKDLVEGWLARASNPATGMDVELRTAQERILKLKHKIKEERKISELKQQEDTIQAEKLEKVFMIMAKEITNLQEGKTPELSSIKEKELKIAQEKLEIMEKQIEELVEKLERSNRIKKYFYESC